MYEGMLAKFTLTSSLSIINLRFYGFTFPDTGLRGSAISMHAPAITIDTLLVDDTRDITSKLSSGSSLESSSPAPAPATPTPAPPPSSPLSRVDASAAKSNSARASHQPVVFLRLASSTQMYILLIHADIKIAARPTAGLIIISAQEPTSTPGAMSLQSSVFHDTDLNGAESAFDLRVPTKVISCTFSRLSIYKYMFRVQTPTGGLNLSKSTVERCSFSSGSSLFYYDESNLERLFITDSEFLSNTAVDSILFDFENATVAHSKFVNNAVRLVTSDSPLITLPPTYGTPTSASYLEFESNTGTIKLAQNCALFSANITNHRGSMVLDIGTRLHFINMTLSQGVPPVACPCGECNFYSSNFTSNANTLGSGGVLAIGIPHLLVQCSGTMVPVIAQNCIFDNNTAMVDGSVAVVNVDTQFNNCLFTNNAAQLGVAGFKGVAMIGDQWSSSTAATCRSDPLRKQYNSTLNDVQVSMNECDFVAQRESPANGAYIAQQSVFTPYSPQEFQMQAIDFCGSVILQSSWLDRFNVEIAGYSGPLEVTTTSTPGVYSAMSTIVRSGMYTFFASTAGQPLQGTPHSFSVRTSIWFVDAASISTANPCGTSPETACRSIDQACALSNPSDTILVKPATYIIAGNIQITMKPSAIIAPYPPDEDDQDQMVDIRCNGSQDTVLIAHTNATIIGMSFRDCSSHYFQLTGSGVNFENCSFQNFRDITGVQPLIQVQYPNAGLNSFEVPTRFSNCSFGGATVLHSQPLLAILSGASTFTNCTFRTINGYALQLASSSTNQFDNCLFDSNLQPAASPLLLLSATGPMRFAGCMLRNNSAPGSIMQLISGTQLQVHASVFTNNTAWNAPSILSLVGEQTGISLVEIYQSHFANNIGAGSAAVLDVQHARVVVANSTFESNVMSTPDNFVACTQCNSTLYTQEHTSASARALASAPAPASTSAPAPASTSAPAPATLNVGSSISIGTSNHSLCINSVVLASSDARFEYCSFENNRVGGITCARQGATLVIINQVLFDTTVITNCHFADNIVYAVRGAGAIASLHVPSPYRIPDAFNTLEITNCTFERMRVLVPHSTSSDADGHGALPTNATMLPLSPFARSISGAVLLASYHAHIDDDDDVSDQQQRSASQTVLSKATISGSDFVGNAVQNGAGGAVCVREPWQVTVTSSRFESNSAANGAAASIQNGDANSFTGCEFINNTASVQPGVLDAVMVWGQHEAVWNFNEYLSCSIQSENAVHATTADGTSVLIVQSTPIINNGTLALAQPAHASGIRVTRVPSDATSVFVAGDYPAYYVELVDICGLRLPPTVDPTLSTQLHTTNRRLDIALQLVPYNSTHLELAFTSPPTRASNYSLEILFLHESLAYVDVFSVVAAAADATRTFASGPGVSQTVMYCNDRVTAFVITAVDQYGNVNVDGNAEFCFDLEPAADTTDCVNAQQPNVTLLEQGEYLAQYAVSACHNLRTSQTYYVSVMLYCDTIDGNTTTGQQIGRSPYSVAIAPSPLTQFQRVDTGSPGIANQPTTVLFHAIDANHHVIDCSKIIACMSATIAYCLESKCTNFDPSVPVTSSLACQPNGTLAFEFIATKTTFYQITLLYEGHQQFETTASIGPGMHQPQSTRTHTHTYHWRSSLTRTQPTRHATRLIGASHLPRIIDSHRPCCWNQLASGISRANHCWPQLYHHHRVYG
jgi:hypothetical protein